MTSRRLTGSRCLCRGCGEYFNSVHAFDSHRVWDSPTVQRCLNQEELVRKGMSINSSGFWITEPHRKHRVKRVTSRILAALRDTPVGHQGGGL
jgi:hypothetical protein